MKKEKRLIIVSNRLPVTVTKDDSIKYEESSGGLVTALKTYLSKENMESLWVGWPGISSEEKQEEIKEHLLKNHKSLPVFLNEEDKNLFYDGFSNKTIWPLFHYFESNTTYDEKYWEAYKKVNEIFYETIKPLIKEDDIIWVHDYHLMLLPSLIRKDFPNASIGFFLHIPFPSYEMYRLLPKKWAKEIIEGILGSSIIGFHTHDYMKYFLRCALRYTGTPHNFGKMIYEDRIIKADVFPISIDFRKFFETASSEKVIEKAREIKNSFPDSKIIFSVDRLDYTKGILNRLKGYEKFLENNPEFINKVVLGMVIVPSRTTVDSYQDLKKEVEEKVSNINGKFGSHKWAPISYQYSSLSFEDLVAWYSAAEVALITPIRDGMNLVAKEYVSSRPNQTGNLILSEMTGAAKELMESHLIDPYSKEEIAESILKSLTMSEEEQKERIGSMQNRIKKYDVFKWATSFVNSITQNDEEQRQLREKFLDPIKKEELIRDYNNSNKRLIVLDYDGTLVPFMINPERANPSDELKYILRKLSEKNTIVIASGRDKTQLDSWFKENYVDIIAEHGAWIRKGEWNLSRQLSTEWKEPIKSTLESYSERLPGSFVEEKTHALTFHHRASDPEQAEKIIRELHDELGNFLANTSAQVFLGNKILEVRAKDITKSTSLVKYLDNSIYDFILAIGDDETDEDIFGFLKNEAYTLKVGFGQTLAKFNMRNNEEVISLLKELSSKTFPLYDYRPTSFQT